MSSIFIHHSSFGNYLLTFPSIRTMCCYVAHYSFSIHSLSTQYLFNLHSLLTQYPFTVHPPYTHCSLNFHPPITLHSQTVPSLVFLHSLYSFSTNSLAALHPIATFTVACYPSISTTALFIPSLPTLCPLYTHFLLHSLISLPIQSTKRPPRSPIPPGHSVARSQTTD